MTLLFSFSGFLEIAVFLVAVAAFITAVRFFMDSRKRLEEAFPGILGRRRMLSFGFDRNGFLIPLNTRKKPMPGQQQPALRQNSQHPDSTKEELKQLRQQLQQQQQELQKALAKMASYSQPPAAVPGTSQPWEDQKKQEELRLQMDYKEAEFQRLKNQEVYTEKLQQRLMEVQGAFSELQEKMQQMEKQAWEAAELTMQLEHTEQAQLQAEKALHRKEEKLREVSLENQRLHEACNELEDKLSEANLQRQQLLKKVQMLESLNADMVQMAEANRKLKTQMARVAELESMLHLMTEGKVR